MFNTTHTFVGFAIAKTGAEKWVRHAALTAVIASNLPDIDSVAGFWGTAAYLDHHRGITHSITGVPALAFLLAGAMYFFTRQFWRTYAVALTAMATHPLLDYLNPYGLRPFVPWNSTWYYGDLVFIFDPYLDLILFSGLLLGWFRPRLGRTAALVSLALAASYVGLRIELHSQANAAAANFAIQERDAGKWAAMPTMRDPREWTVITASSSEVARFDCVLPCEPMRPSGAEMFNSPPSPVTEAAAKASSAAALLRFARFPVRDVEKLPSGYRVMFIDYRFFRAGSQSALGAEVVLDDDLRITSDRLSFQAPPLRRD